MLRLLSRGRKAEDGEDKPKKYQKADLGQPNKMYYNDELKMWVEKGKEAAARAEKEKLNAPPPSVGSMSAASSSASLAAMAEGGGPSFTRSKGLASRYVSTIPTAPNSTGSSPAQPAPKLPGMGGMGGLPGIPGGAGPKIPAGPPSFFMPTPTASEAPSEAMNGSDVGSVSGMDASFPNSRNTSMPNFFMPGPAPSSSTTEDTQATSSANMDAFAGDAAGLRSSSGSGAAVPASEGQRGSSTGFSLRDSDTSGTSTRFGAGSGPSFAAWEPRQDPRESAGESPTGPAGVAGAGEDLVLGQQGSSSADMEADAQAEVSSTPGLFVSKQQHPEQQWPGAHSNDHTAPYGNGYAAAGQPGELGAEHLGQVGSYEAAAAADGQQGLTQPLATEVSASWDSRPAVDPFGVSEAAPAATVPAQVESGWEGAEGGFGGVPEGGYGGQWQPEGQQYGGQWQPDGQQYAPGVQQPQDPEGAAAGGEWATGAQQDSSNWGQQTGWGGEWGTGAAVEGGAGGEGGVTAFSGGPAADEWQQPAVEGGSTWQDQQPVADGQQSGYQAAYGDGQQYNAGAYGEQQYDAAAYGEQQYNAAAYGEQQYNAAAYGEQQYNAADPAAQPYTQQYGADPTAAYQQQQPGQGELGAFGGYQQPTDATSSSAVQPLPMEVLPPVHPQLPGISIAAPGSGAVTSPTYALPPAGGSSGSRGRARGVTSPGSPLARQTSMGALLPQPPRHSAGGLGGQQPMGVAAQADASAVVLPTAVAAGDASLLYAIRPSSPYARTVSPLSRTSTGKADGLVSRKSSGGFPIPSPPGHAGMLSTRSPSGSMFLPGGAITAGAAAGAVPTPWQPRASDPAAGEGVPVAQQQQQQHGMMNGYDAAAYSQWQQPQQQGMQQADDLGQPAGAGGGGAPPAVPTFQPGLLESLPRDAPPSSAGQRDSTTQQQQQQQQAWTSHLPQGAAPAAARRSDGATAKPAAATRAHPYDQFLNERLSQVNWRAVHWRRQPGKLNKMLPWEELEIEQAQEEEAEQAASGQARQSSPFWYRQMEFRQKLPAGSMKPSASEPAAMPSHAVPWAPPPTAAGSEVSQHSALPGWPQYGQQQQEHYSQPQQQYGQQQQFMPPGSPLTPARAAASDGMGAVAGGSALQQQHEEPTPTSKLIMPAAADSAEGGEASAVAAVGADGMQQADGAGAWQQSQGDVQQQANGYWQQGQQYDAQYGQQYDPQYGQQYVQYDQYGQPYYADQQYYAEQQQAYDMSQWQQQQPQPAEAGSVFEQAAAATAGEQASAAAVQGWSGEHDGYRAASWGSPDAEMLESGPVATEAHAAAAAGHQCQQQQQQPLQQQESYPAAAAGEVTGGWGADDAVLDLQLGLVVHEPQAAAAAAAATIAAVDPAGHHELHAADVIETARAARISTSSLGLESQPSTGRVAAAAAKRIVSGALANILLEHAVPEDAEQETAAAGVTADWAGVEGEADGWGGAELDLGEGLVAAGGDYAAAADDAAAAAEDEAAAVPVSAAWSKLAQQFTAAADAAAAMGAMNPDLETYQAYFVQYGEYLLGALPRPALEQAGLLAPESADSHVDTNTSAGAAAAGATTAGATTAGATAAEVAEQQQQQQQQQEEEDEEMWAEFGNLQLKDETAASMFAVLGFDTGSLLACMGEA